MQSGTFQKTGGGFGWLVAWCTAVAALCGPAVPAALAQEKPALLADGALSGAAPAVRDFMAVTLDGPKLQLDHNNWTAPVGRGAATTVIVAGNPTAQFNALFSSFTKVRTALGGGSSSTSSSGTTRSMTFTGGNGISADIRASTSGISIAFRETDPPSRSIEVTENTDESMRILMTSGSGDLLMLIQPAQGAVSLITITKGKVVAASGENFLKLYKAQIPLFESYVMPAFKGLGLGVSFDLSDPAVIGAVAARLQDAGPDTVQKAKAIIERLDSDDFHTREEATQELADRFAAMLPVIRQALAQPGLSAEVASRLKAVMDQHPEQQKYDQMIDSFDLTRDPRTLVRCLATADAASKPAVAAQLKKVTGQNLGADPAAWQKWLDQQPAPANDKP